MSDQIKTFKEELAGNPYAGRGVLVGVTPDGKRSAIAYFIMGRSENSRNRVFVKDGDDLMIKPFDESKVEDPSLIIYYPLRVTEKAIVVTNGDQTDTVRDHLAAGGSFESALRTRTFEPDGPNWTPRISGISYPDGSCTISILKCTDGEGIKASRQFFDYDPVPGTGRLIHTYVTDGKPLPTFVGEPKAVAVPDDPKAFADEIWETLDDNNKISLYVRYTDLETGRYEDIIVNKHER